jgi:STAS domain
MSSNPTTARPTDATAPGRPPLAALLSPCAPATGGPNPRHPVLAAPRTTAVSTVEVILGTPIEIDVQGWGGDAVAVVTVDGGVDADSCAALATALAKAARTYQAVIIDLTHVRLLSAAGLHCLDCVGQVPDEQPDVVHLVCADSSRVRGVLQQARLRHRWPIHPDLTDAIGQVMQLPADQPEPTSAPYDPRASKAGRWSDRHPGRPHQPSERPPARTLADS